MTTVRMIMFSIRIVCPDAPPKNGFSDFCCNNCGERLYCQRLILTNRWGEISVYRDIFDRLMALPLLRVLEPFYRKHKEALLYLFFGGLTTVVSIAIFALFNTVLGVNELLANIISWILAVAFAFFTNRIWVFSAPSEGKGSFLKQMLSFFGGRLFTLAVEEAGLFVFVSRLRFPGIAVKTAAQVLVIVLNYVISKWIVFRA